MYFSRLRGLSRLHMPRGYNQLHNPTPVINLMRPMNSAPSAKNTFIPFGGQFYTPVFEPYLQQQDEPEQTPISYESLDIFQHDEPFGLYDIKPTFMRQQMDLRGKRHEHAKKKRARRRFGKKIIIQ